MRWTVFLLLAWSCEGDASKGSGEPVDPRPGRDAARGGGVVWGEVQDDGFSRHVRCHC